MALIMNGVIMAVFASVMSSLRVHWSNVLSMQLGLPVPKISLITKNVKRQKV